MEDKGKKTEKATPGFMEKGPLGTIGPKNEDGKGGVIDSIKQKLVSRNSGATAALGDQTSNAVRGAMGAIKTPSKSVSETLSKNPVKKIAPRVNPSPLSKITVKRSVYSGLPASGYKKVDRSSSQPSYGTPAK